MRTVKPFNGSLKMTLVSPSTKCLGQSEHQVPWSVRAPSALVQLSTNIVINIIINNLNKIFCVLVKLLKFIIFPISMVRVSWPGTRDDRLRGKLRYARLR